ncbi:hypothetical protein C27AD_00850 [Salinisphaera hydrothermalis C27AD]
MWCAELVMNIDIQDMANRLTTSDIGKTVHTVQIVEVGAVNDVLLDLAPFCIDLPILSAIARPTRGAPFL